MNRVRRMTPRLVLSATLAGALLVLPAVLGGVTSVTGGMAAHADGGGHGAESGGGHGGMGSGAGSGHDMKQGAHDDPGQQMKLSHDPMGGTHMNAETVRGVQRALNRMGYHAGPVDGMMGPRTRSAVAAYQGRHGMMADGMLSSDLAERILKDAETN